MYMFFSFRMSEIATPRADGGKTEIATPRADGGKTEIATPRDDGVKSGKKVFLSFIDLCFGI